MDIHQAIRCLVVAIPVLQDARHELQPLQDLTLCQLVVAVCSNGLVRRCHQLVGEAAILDGNCNVGFPHGRTHEALQGLPHNRGGVGAGHRGVLQRGVDDDQQRVQDDEEVRELGDGLEVLRGSPQQVAHQLLQVRPNFLDQLVGPQNGDTTLQNQIDHPTGAILLGLVGRHTHLQEALVQGLDLD
eukprot:6363337-Heterocapsa_arctica.AAC.1